MASEQENLDGEVWLTIPGYPDYDVSNLGRVRSWLEFRRGRSNAPRIRKLWIDSVGYPTFGARRFREGPYQPVRVHRAVLFAFIGEPTPSEVTRHLDGSRDNNRLSNLCWGSESENVADTRRHGRLKTKLTEEQVREIRSTFKRGNGGMLMRKFGIKSSRTLQQIIRREKWKHIQ